MDDQDNKLTEPTDSSAKVSPEVIPDGGSSVLLNLDSMIKGHLQSLERLQEDLEKHSGMLNDIFENSPTYKEHSEKAKEAAKIKSATKQQILKQPQAAELSTKVQGLKSEIKEIKDALSDYVQEYQRMSGVNEIEGHDGEVREIVYTAKLIKKGSKFRG